MVSWKVWALHPKGDGNGCWETIRRLFCALFTLLDPSLPGKAPKVRRDCSFLSRNRPTSVSSLSVGLPGVLSSKSPRSINPKIVPWQQNPSQLDLWDRHRGEGSSVYLPKSSSAFKIKFTCYPPDSLSLTPDHPLSHTSFWQFLRQARHPRATQPFPLDLCLGSWIPLNLFTVGFILSFRTLLQCHDFLEVFSDGPSI